MADEQYRWLDRDTAERLLRGEPLDAVDAGNRDQAYRLTEALEALDALGTQSAESTPADAELPGEAAALAAFRKARTGKNGEQATLGPRTRTRSAASATAASSAASSAASQISSDAGLIHLGRPAEHRRVPSRWGRPVRYGLAAALAAGMIGGAAMAATSGALPFGGEEPEPGSSATASVTPDRPLVSPSPEKKPGGGPDRPRPDGSAGGPTGKDSAPDGEARGGTDPGARPDPGDDRREGRTARGWRWLASACRDFRDGKNLDSERRRGLEDSANGAEQVKKYCQGILRNWDDRDSGDGRRGIGSGGGGAGRSGSGWNNDREDTDDRSNDDGDDGGGDGSHIGAGAFRSGSGSGSGTVRLRSGSAEPAAFASVRPSSTRTPTPVRTLLQAPVRAPVRAPIQASGAPTPTPVRTPIRALAPETDAPTRPAAAATSALSTPDRSTPDRSTPDRSTPDRSTGSKPRSTEPRAAAPRSPRALPALSSSS
ncbi:hypothetical protein [Streptomyces sp. NPDC050988]|uniref:hypothetical protein n=1 Tax=Streptomyces sp. NPDC050988 TaxID=3365637 RepID=UPI0037ACEA2A